MKDRKDLEPPPNWSPGDWKPGDPIPGPGSQRPERNDAGDFNSQSNDHNRWEPQTRQGEAGDGAPPPPQGPAGEPGREIDPETGLPVSRSKDVKFGSQAPFFLLLLFVVFAGFFAMMMFWETPEFDPSTYGAPDITLEDAVSRLFYDARATTGTVSVESMAYFLDDILVLQMKLHKIPPFTQGAITRANEAMTAIRTGQYKRLTPHPYEPPPGSAMESILYERSDFTTGVNSETSLILVRTPEGWRIGGFL